MRIIVPIGCRSDKVLSTPLIKKLNGIKEFEVSAVELRAGKYIESYKVIESLSHVRKIDFALLVGDRIEMCAAAAACFHNRIRIGHVYAGVINSIATVDDINRHVISLWSDIQFCESEPAVKVVKALKYAVGLPCDVYGVGITHFDDIVLNINISTNKFDLVLYNPPTLWDVCKQMDVDVNEIVKAVKNDVVLINPNPDDGNQYAFDKLQQEFKTNCIRFIEYDDLNHSDFVHLISSCKQFITNSSSSVYEAPLLIEPCQIVHIGNRNLARAKGPFKLGASGKIVRILRETLKRCEYSKR